MNKIIVVGVIVIVGIFIVGISIYDSQEPVGNVLVEEGLDTQKKSYSVILTESVNVNTP